MNIFQKKLNTLTKLFKTGYEEMWHEQNSYNWYRSQMKIMRKQNNELTIEGIKERIIDYKRHNK